MALNNMNGTVHTPKILHQTWKTREVPENLRAYAESWKTAHPDYQYILHTDADIDELVRTKTPQFYQAYKGFKKHIERVDFSRYVMLWHYGGTYIDLDEKCLKSITPLVSQNRIFLAPEPSEHNIFYNVGPVLCNAFMISPPKQLFWMHFMEYIVEHYHKNAGTPVYTTGPMALTNFWNHTWDRDKYMVQVLSSCSFFPMTDYMTNRKVDGHDAISRDCPTLDQSYGIHVWQHTWCPEWQNWFSRYRREMLNGVVGFLCIVVALLLAWFATRRRSRATTAAAADAAVDVSTPSV